MSNENIAREVVDGFFPRWHNAEVGRVYQGDQQRYELNIRGQRAIGILANMQWVLHEGDWVGCIGPDPKSRQYLIIAYFGSANPGDWFSDDEDVLPDLTTGQGPIPGFRPPIDADTLWYTVTRGGDEEERSRSLIPRPAGGDEYPGANDHYVRVIAGQPDPDEMTLGVPGDGLPPSYGPFSAIGDRIQITKGLPFIPKPGQYCITAARAASQGDTLTYQAYTLLNYHPLGVNHPLQGIGMGLCNPSLSDKTTLQFGTSQMASQSEGIELDILYRIEEGRNTRLYYLKFAPFLSDMFFCVGVFDGQAAVGIGREILFGMDYPYPSGGAASEGGNATPYTQTWFNVTPWEVDTARKLYNRDGAEVGLKVTHYQNIYVKYWGVTDPVHGDCCYIKVSDGVGGGGARQWKTYFVSGQIFGGNPPGDLYGYGGDGKGYIYGPIKINDRRYPLIEPRSPNLLKGIRGEIAWHEHVWPGDPAPEGGTYVDEPGDTLPDALFVWLDNNHVLFLNGQVINVDNYGAIMSGRDIERLANPHADISHSELSDLDSDDHEQYPTVARLPQFIEDAGITTDDIPASDTKGYVSPTERATWSAGATPTREDLTAAVDGATVAFTTTDPYVPGTLKVWVNSTELRNGKDFRETTDAQGFEIDYRTPTNESPADVLRVAYQSA